MSKLQESGEMYLETIYRLAQKSPFVRSIDVATEMNFSKPSISRAMGILKDSGYITIERDGKIDLTDAGLAVAKRTFERHEVLTRVLTSLGVSPAVAEEDACRMEHIISEETFNAIKNHVKAEHDLNVN